MVLYDTLTLVKKELFREVVQTLCVGLFVFLVFSVYLFLRRGYYNLSIANKAFGSTAAILAGITLVLGPLARTYDWIDRYVVLRKPLGLLALLPALVHTAISIFPLPARWLPATLGGVAVILWLYLAAISRPKTIQTMGPALWRARQSLLARIAFLAIFVHVILLKYPEWLRWFAKPGYPPASLFVFLIMLVVLLYRGFFLKK